MVIKSVNLETVCGVSSAFPDNTLPEIAFAGKSNVGKSSLINAVMNRKSLARHRQSIFIMSIPAFIWWTCRDTDMRRPTKRSRRSGEK